MWLYAMLYYIFIFIFIFIVIIYLISGLEVSPTEHTQALPPIILHHQPQNLTLGFSHATIWKFWKISESYTQSSTEICTKPEFPSPNALLLCLHLMFAASPNPRTLWVFGFFSLSILFRLKLPEKSQLQGQWSKTAPENFLLQFGIKRSLCHQTLQWKVKNVIKRKLIFQSTEKSPDFRDAGQWPAHDYEALKNGAGKISRGGPGMKGDFYPSETYDQQQRFLGNEGKQMQWTFSELLAWISSHSNCMG